MRVACPAQATTAPGLPGAPHPWRQAVYLLAQPQRLRPAADRADPVHVEGGPGLDRAAAAAGGARMQFALRAEFVPSACGEVAVHMDWC